MSDQNILQADLESHLSTFSSSPRSRSKLGAGLRFQGRILDWLREKIENGILTPEAKLQLKAVALQVFDSFDIPYIGGILESSVKQMLRPIFETLIDKILKIEPTA